MEAETSQDLTSACRGPRRADGVIPVWGRRPMSQLISQEEQQIFPSSNFLFCLGPQWMAHPGG